MMKKYLVLCSLAIALLSGLLAGGMMVPTDTPNLGLNRPDPGSSGWDVPLNENFDLLDLYTKQMPNQRRATLVIAPGSGTAMNVMGDIATITGTASAIAADATDPTTENLLSGAVSGNESGLNGNAIYRSAASRRLMLQTYAKLQETSNVRAWICLTDQTLATQAGSDNPAGNYACFRYSTPASDANWKAVTKDGTTQNVADTGVAISTTGTEFEIEFDDTNSKINFRINGTLTNTLSANLPGAANLRYVVVAETQEAVAKNIRVAWLAVASAK
jgi:hypothetical protein